MREQEQVESFIDIHCHVMPGVDDGSKDPEMSLRMLKIARDNQIDTMILTPHNTQVHRCASPEGIQRRLLQLKEMCLKNGISMHLYPGNELYYDSTLPERLSAGQALTLAGSRYALIEFDPSSAYTYIRDGLNAVACEGYYPILAHVERYQNMLGHVDRAQELVRAGIYIQVNAGDVIPKMLRPDTRYVGKLLKEGLVHFVATDAHRDSGRAPYLEECAQYLSRKYEEDYVYDLLRGNAQKILKDQKL
jgi:protein-tyrosine phosphatase